VRFHFRNGGKLLSAGATISCVNSGKKWATEFRQESLNDNPKCAARFRPIRIVEIFVTFSTFHPLAAL
jgi:hypothetical protein